MIKTLTISGLAVLGLSLPLAAQEQEYSRLFVHLPDLSAFESEAAEQFASQLILALVVGRNCLGADMSEAEASLIGDSADLLAMGELGLDATAYDEQIFGPAFDALDKPGTCEKVIPKFDHFVTRLEALGGSLEPLPDQTQALADWNARMDAYDERNAQ